MHFVGGLFVFALAKLYVVFPIRAGIKALPTCVNEFA